MMRLAMWSGPRNVSTAFMRSWGNRDDTVVVDEPFYACYLKLTGLAHPGRDEVLLRHETDWQRVVETLLAPQAPGVEILYQKQMSHHLLPEMGREWLGSMTHAFLIRDPGPMLESLGEKLTDFDLLATGLPQQMEIFEHVVRATGHLPPVVDAADLLAAPEPVLRALCAALGVRFTSSMLHWPPGPRPTDGAWARHWYERVERSSGFEPVSPGKPPRLTGRLAEMAAHCRPMYETLRAHRIMA